MGQKLLCLLPDIILGAVPLPGRGGGLGLDIFSCGQAVVGFFVLQVLTPFLSLGARGAGCWPQESGFLLLHS